MASLDTKALNALKEFNKKGKKSCSKCGGDMEKMEDEEEKMKCKECGNEEKPKD